MTRAEKKALRIKESGAYASWRNMRNRCMNKNRHNAHIYIEKGIKCCERWNSFELFLEDMGSRPESHSLDRLDGNKGYYKENCQWATTSQQNRNTTQNILTFEMAVEIAFLRLTGMAHTEIGKKFGINKNTSRNIMRGTSWGDALAAAKKRLESND